MVSFLDITIFIHKKVKTTENTLLARKIPKKILEKYCEKLLPIKPNLYKLI